MKLRRIAEHVVLTGTDPAQITAADLPAPPTRPARREPAGTPLPAHPTRLSTPARTPGPRPGLQITVGAAGGCPLLRVAGEIDLATRENLQDGLRAALDRTRDGALIVDLSQVTFCDGGGGRTLLDAARHAEQNGTSLRIVPSAPLERVLDLLGLQHALEIHPDPGHGAAGQRAR